MKAATELRRLFDLIIVEVDSNRDLARRVAEVFESTRKAPESASPSRRRGRRAPGVLDPIIIMRQLGADELVSHLRVLTVDQLKDIVAEQSMDSSKLALKWKTPARLIDLIVRSSRERLSKGDAFR